MMWQVVCEECNHGTPDGKPLYEILWQITWSSRGPLQWRHNESFGVSNHQPHDCLLSRLFKAQIKEKSKLRVTGFCAGNSQVIDEFPTQRASNAENVSIWWRHHGHRPIFSSSIYKLPSVLQQTIFIQRIVHRKVCLWSSWWSFTISVEIWMQLHNSIGRIPFHPTLSGQGHPLFLFDHILLSIYREWCMYSSDELFQRSREGYLGIYFLSCEATMETNTTITLEWAQK